LNAVHVRGLTGERSRTIPGIVGVAVTGWLVEATGTYSAAFLLSAAVSVMGALVYAVFFEARAVVE
jgi:ACS family sodium-dependent inorganic phosphate cotransporter